MPGLAATLGSAHSLAYRALEPRSLCGKWVSQKPK